MARTIGRKNIRIVKELTREALESGKFSYSQIEDIVIKKLPSDMWDTWEMADQEIKRIIDEVMADY